MDTSRVFSKLRLRQSYLFPGLIILSVLFVSRVFFVVRIDENSDTLHALAPSVEIMKHRDINSQLTIERYLEQSGYLTPERTEQVGY